MSQQNSGIKTFTATSAVTLYSRVKLTTSSGTAVELSGSAEAFIGVAQNVAAAGELVTVRLKDTSSTFKVVAAEALLVGATIYAAAAGKVKDTSAGTAIGTALEAASADLQVIEVLLDIGTGATVSSTELANYDTSHIKGAIPVVFHRTCTVAAGAETITLATLGRKMLVVDAWVIARDTAAANVTITDATNNITNAMAKSTTDDTFTRATVIVAEYDEVAAAGTIVASISANSVSDVFVTCLPIA